MDVMSRGLHVNRPLMQEKALAFVNNLLIAEFKASNRWLESLRKRHNINFVTQCGKSADVDEKIIDDWKEKLPSLINSYEPRNIYNMDETGPFF